MPVCWCRKMNPRSHFRRICVYARGWESESEIVRAARSFAAMKVNFREWALGVGGEGGWCVQLCGCRNASEPLSRAITVCGGVCAVCADVARTCMSCANVLGPKFSFCVTLIVVETKKLNKKKNARTVRKEEEKLPYT